MPTLRAFQNVIVPPPSVCLYERIPKYNGINANAIPIYPNNSMLLLNPDFLSIIMDRNIRQAANKPDMVPYFKTVFFIWFGRNNRYCAAKVKT